jgi:hypothetical protein
MENIRVRRAGYAFRMEYGPFLERYKMLCGVTWPKWQGPARDGVKHVRWCFFLFFWCCFLIIKKKQKKNLAAAHGWRCRSSPSSS